MKPCEKCSQLASGTSDGHGHDDLISLGQVQTMDEARRGVRHEVFTCAVCGTDWDYVLDKESPADAWKLALTQ